MAIVPGVLLDHVQIDPAQRERPRQGGARARSAHGHRVSSSSVATARRARSTLAWYAARTASATAESRSSNTASGDSCVQYPALAGEPSKSVEPRLHARHVPHQPEQRQPGTASRAAAQADRAPGPRICAARSAGGSPARPPGLAVRGGQGRAGEQIVALDIGPGGHGGTLVRCHGRCPLINRRARCRASWPVGGVAESSDDRRLVASPVRITDDGL